MNCCVYFQGSSENTGGKKVVVLERKTGRIVTGPLAPTEDSLQNWIEQHQTFEVLCPSVKTSTFYSSKLPLWLNPYYIMLYY